MAVVTPPAVADQPPQDQAVEAKFCASAKNQFDITQCSERVAKAADSQLNATYHAVLRKWAEYPSIVTKLREAQREWLRYRDADLAARFALENGEGAMRGTAYPSAYAFYEASLERERSARLCEYLRGTAYGERDSAPCAELVRHPFIIPGSPAAAPAK